MRKYLLRLSLLLLVAVPVYARQAPGKVVKETWDAAYLEQKGGAVRCGYLHATVHELERGGQKLYRTTLEMNLTVKRANVPVKLRVETGAEETPEGKITSLFLTQFVDKGKQQTVIGEVKDNKFQLKLGDTLLGPAKPWNNDALGMYAQDRLLKERKVKPGDTLEYLNFEMGLQQAVPVKARIKDLEEVDALVDNKNGDKPAAERVRKKLLRVETLPQKVEIDGKAVQLPGMLSWLDKDREAVRGQMELPGLGRLVLYRTSETIAKQEGAAPALLPDLLLENFIKLDMAIDTVHDAKVAVYRVTVKDDDSPETIFSRDTRQSTRNLKDNTFELEVKALRGPDGDAPQAKNKDEYQKSSFFLDSDSEAVKELTAKAVGTETDPWKKCLRIEKWVHGHMIGDSGIGYVTASTIARDRRGDCRQHGMLSAAMCRAAGVPARTAIGLVYVNLKDSGPVLAFHMWTEVLVQNQWLAIDAVMGKGGVGPGHLKITDHSWADTQTLAPLVPLLRAMGKIKVQVVSVE